MHCPQARLRGRVADKARRVRLARVQVRRAQERLPQQVRGQQACVSQLMHRCSLHACMPSAGPTMAGRCRLAHHYLTHVVPDLCKILQRSMVA